MNTKHTPGPWEVTNGLDVFTKLAAPRNDGLRVAHNDGWHIANCDGMHSFLEDGTEESLEYAEKIANARLIAAAPELLEALILLEAEMVASGNAASVDYGWKPAIEKTRAAIAKATGEQA